MAVRFNNFGNIRSFYRNGSWSKPFDGEIMPPLFTAGQSSGYRKFSSPAYGYRALFKVLMNNYLMKGINTIEKIFPIYAPIGDQNDPSAYIANVEKMTGIPRSKMLTSYAELIPVVKAITKVETGTQAVDADVMSGFNLVTGKMTPEKPKEETPSTPSTPKKKVIEILIPVAVIITGLVIYQTYAKQTRISGR